MLARTIDKTGFRDVVLRAISPVTLAVALVLLIAKHRDAILQMVAGTNARRAKDVASREARGTQGILAVDAALPHGGLVGVPSLTRGEDGTRTGNAAEGAMDEAPLRHMPQVSPASLPLWGVALCAFALRIPFISQQSAFMDEASFVLIGRLLLEQNAVYDHALEWTYGSYLWPLIAGICDIAGGLGLVRIVAACCGATMAVSTAVLAERLGASRGAAITAGLLMATFPTAIGVGRFGTYDALAAAAFMGSLAILPSIAQNRWRPTPALLACVVLLYIAFLSKYIVAIYLPFICVGCLLAPQGRRVRLRTLVAFVLPLCLAVLAYFVAFAPMLIYLLDFSRTYTALRSEDLWRAYVWQRPELWLLAVAAIAGAYRSPRRMRVAAACGGGIIVAFQLLARADVDWWKHSIYLIFFLAPLAGVAIWSVVKAVYAYVKRHLHRAAWRTAGGVGALTITGIVPVALGVSLTAAQPLVAWYPDLTAALPAIAAQTRNAHTVLTDDSTLRYYLYPQLRPDRVIDPFSFRYRDEDGSGAYRLAISEQYFDAIVLDGGTGPVGQRIRREYGPLIARSYTRVYAQSVRGGLVEIFRPQRALRITHFDDGIQGWGGQPTGVPLQTGLQTTTSLEQPWDGAASLRFVVTPEVPIVAVRVGEPVMRVVARVYLEPASPQPRGVRIGMFGFDANWQWHDDGFVQVIPAQQWTDVVWDLHEPGMYQEIGFKFPADAVRVAYVGRVEIVPFSPLPANGTAA